MPKIVKVPCRSCLGDAVDAAGMPCPACIKGLVQGFCACGMVADLVSGIEPFCLACSAPCVLCGVVTEMDDRLPFGGCGFAHSACAMRFGMVATRFLEAPGPAYESERSDSADTRVSNVNRYVGQQVPMKVPKRKGKPMPRPSVRTIEMMRQRGFVHLSEAARLTGHARTTLYARIMNKTLVGEKSGLFHFVSWESLSRFSATVHAPPGTPPAGETP